MSVTRAEAKLASGTLPYAVLGEGRPLLYLHAAGGPLISPVLEGLAASHRVYAPIAPGFDGTPVHDTVKGIPGLADLYIAFVEAVIKTPVDVMGHSFGGWTALWMALKQPDLIDQLVLEAPGGLRFGATPTPPAGPDEIIRRLYAYPEKAKPFIMAPEATAANMQAFARYHSGILVDEELAGRLPQIKARTLVILASKDMMIPAKTGQVLKEKIPSSHITYVYDAAHAIEIDQPERMLRLVKAFLERGESYIVNFGGAAA
ncbi:MAG TPA: alpha/beta hydrolase [Xanthobacteraceae bacterium]|nr:alpha/beta hydrolase [Xanthobacteraceae bacterium]